MTPSWSEVNAAVMAVLGEFGRTNHRPSVRRQVPRSDVFVERLFSLKHAEALGEVDEVKVASGTVVTPLAKDWLRRRKIVLRVVSKQESSFAGHRYRGEWGFSIEWKKGQVEAIRRNLLEDWLEIGEDPVEAARWLLDSESRGALVMTDEASVATWRANRVQGIRAATVVEPEGVSRAIRALGANMIVVEPSGKSIYLLKQISERFRQGGIPVVPEWFEAEASR